MKVLLLLFVFSKLMGLGPDDKLENDRKGAIVKSPEIEVSEQYGGVPCVPIFHHYTNFERPHFLMALQGKMPSLILENDLKLVEVMKSVGVVPEDPLIIMVQGFSGIANSLGTGLEPNPSQPLLSRPMYYYSQNRDHSCPSNYNEAITVTVKLYDPFESKEIIPTGANGQYGVSIHNSGQQKALVSSTGNMGIPSLKYNESSCFFGLYKGKSRAVTGVPKVRPELDMRGVSVFHVVLGEKDRDILADALSQCSTPRDILEVLSKDFIDPKINGILMDVLEKMMIN